MVGSWFAYVLQIHDAFICLFMLGADNPVNNNMQGCDSQECYATLHSFLFACDAAQAE
jgi:hypothetical protein